MPYYSIRTKSTTSPCLRWRRQVYLLLAHILGKLTAKPVDGSQGNRVPAPKSVHCQWGEGDPLIGAPLFVLPHLPGVMGALYSTLPSLEGTHHQARLEWIDHRNIKGAVLAIGPEGDQNIRRPIITARQEASWLFHWPAQPAACTAVWKTASLTKLCRAIRSPPMPQEIAWSPRMSLAPLHLAIVPCEEHW